MADPKRNRVHSWQEIRNLFTELQKFADDEDAEAHAAAIIDEVRRARLRHVSLADAGTLRNELLDAEGLLKDAKERIERSIDPPSADFGPQNPDGKCWNLPAGERRRLEWSARCLELRVDLLRHHVDAFDAAQAEGKARSKERRARSLERYRKQRRAQIAIQRAERKRKERQYQEVYEG